MGFIDSLNTRPGTTSFHQLPVGWTPLGELSLPLAVVRGAKPGATVGIISGVHAAEYNGIVTAVRLSKELDPTKMSGTVLIVPVVNVRAFETRNPFRNPLDQVNINRVFPGDPFGSISERMAHVIQSEISLASAAFFDLHSGDLYEAIPWHASVKRVGSAELDERSYALAKLFDTGLLNTMGVGIDDATETSSDEGTYFAGLKSGATSHGAASDAGIPGVLMEAGGAGTVDSDVVKMELEGFENVFRHLDMLPGEPNRDIAHLDTYGMYILKSIYGGLFMPEVQPGDHVTQGQRLGEMWDLQGNVLAELSAPMKGVVLMMFTTPVRSSGETILIFGRTDV